MELEHSLMQYHSSGISSMQAVSPLPSHYIPCRWSHLGVPATQFLHALAEAAMASSATGTATGTDVTKAAFISGAL
jgi:hypothetical protein